MKLQYNDMVMQGEVIDLEEHYDAEKQVVVVTATLTIYDFWNQRDDNGQHEK